MYARAEGELPRQGCLPGVRLHLLVALFTGPNKNHGLVVPGIIHQYRACLHKVMSPKIPRAA